MKKQRVRILDTYPVTHDTKCFRTEKPEEIKFESGQATEIFLDDPEWEDEGRPFTFTNLPEDSFLEFIIKEYPEHDGVTHRLHQLKRGDTLLMKDVFGAINYGGEGLFIAGGAGITPFISILRNLNNTGKIGNNRLIFANKTSADIILHDELKKMMDNQLTNILSDEQIEGYQSGLITRELIVDHLKVDDSKVYLCGPPPMLDSVLEQLSDLEVSEDSIVKEEM